MMRWAFAWVVFAVVSSAGMLARSAPVDIYVTELSCCSVPQYSISVAPSPDLGNIALQVVGAVSWTLAPLSQISIPDSPFVGGPALASLQITSREGQNLVPETGDPLSRTLLATITATGWFSFAVQSGDDYFAYTALNRALTAPIPYRLWFYRAPHPYEPFAYQLADYWLPEPGTTALVALGFAALVLARYCSFARSIL